MFKTIGKIIYWKWAMQINYKLKTFFIYQPGVSFVNSTVIIVQQ